MTAGAAGRIARRDVIGLYTLLGAFNLAAWLWAWLLFHDRPLLLGTALLAYGFGLRHGVDADHIAAIDNVTRKLIQERRVPIGVGLFFALGHSTVVVLAAAAIAASAAALSTRWAANQAVVGSLGTLISAGFLFSIALMNAALLVPIVRAIGRQRRGGAAAEADFDPLLNSGGLLSRLLRPVFRLVGRSWHMYPVGFLFGLSFETSTEIALLGISATQAGSGLPTWSIMVFPVLFAAGMTLVDTTDGLLMVGAYRWAVVEPSRKLWYNLSITLVSVVVALFIGGIEALGLLGERFDRHGLFWDVVGGLNEQFNPIGVLIVGLFAVAWLLSASLLRWRGRRVVADTSR